jgi:molybdopterin-guanine dinucleotide biosynthesis protein A
MMTFGVPATTTGVLLAGGRSSRLGQPKALLDFAGRPLGLHLLDRLASVTDQLLVVTNDPTAYAPWGVPMTTDPAEFAGMGPLAGLLAAIEAASHGVVLTVACDLPFFSPALGAFMLALQADSAADVVIPMHDDLLEPLCAVYSTACRAVIRQRLGAGRRKVASILPDLRVRYVPEEEYRSFGATEQLFFNINTAEDLTEAQARWSSLAVDAGAGPKQH